MTAAASARSAAHHPPFIEIMAAIVEVRNGSARVVQVGRHAAEITKTPAETQRMLPYLSRVSLWLAALAAGVSLFTPGARGALLATVALIALIGALVLRRFQLKARPVVTLDFEATRPLDDEALLEVAAVLSRTVLRAASVGQALRDVRFDLIHELGAHEVTLHEPPSAPDTPLVLPERYPLGEAQCTGHVTGNAAAGFAVPVERQRRVVAMLE